MPDKKVRVEGGLGERTWGRDRVTTHLDKLHLASLRKVSELTQIPMGRLIDQALNMYFRTVGWRDEAAVPPIELSYIKKQIQAGAPKE